MTNFCEFCHWVKQILKTKDEQKLMLKNTINSKYFYKTTVDHRRKWNKRTHQGSKYKDWNG